MVILNLIKIIAKDLNEIIKNLYDKFFKNLTLNVEGQTLILDIEENKIIQSVIINGVEFNRIKEQIKKNF